MEAVLGVEAAGRLRIRSLATVNGRVALQLAMVQPCLSAAPGHGTNIDHGADCRRTHEQFQRDSQKLLAALHLRPLPSLSLATAMRVAAPSASAVERAPSSVQQ